MNAGIEYATRAAQAINADLATPGQPGDFNDLHANEGLEAVQKRIDAARPVGQAAELTCTEAANLDNWAEPLPLNPNERSEPYPVDALPGAIGEAVAEVTRFVQCPVALTACSALSAVSTVAAGLVDVRRAEKLLGPSGLYLLAVADSGERKTSTDRYFTEAIRQWDDAQEELASQEIQTWKAADDAWAAERDGIISAIKDAAKRGEPINELKDKLQEHEARKVERPKVPRLLIGDATSEALTWRLANRWPIGGMLSSEAGSIFGGHAMGRDSRMRNLATLNSLWDASPLAVDRKTSESYTVRSARLTVGLAVQLETIRQFVDGTHGLARGSGFLARFLMAWPDSTQGRRKFQDPPKHWPALTRFHRQLANLLDNPVRFDDFGQMSPVVLDLSPEAKAVWIDFHDSVEVELVPGGDMDEARDVASKAGDNAARIAALFHVFERGPVGSICEENMLRAARIVTWHLYEARRFLNQIAVPEAVSDAMALEEWLANHCRREGLDAVRCNHIQKFGPNRTRRKAALEAALSELEGAGRIRRSTEGRKVIIMLHPKIRDGNHGPA
jgi:putative DNA primase/helicase